LLDAVRAHHDDVGRHRHRLDLVVGDVDAGGAVDAQQRSLRVSTRSFAFRLVRGSSKRRARCFGAVIRAMATRCCRTPEISPGYLRVWPDRLLVSRAAGGGLAGFITL